MPRANLGEVSLHYRRHGDGPPALGIMGFALDQRFWAGQISAVTDTHSFVTFDNRGVGGSTGPPPSTIEDMAADAVALMDHLEIESAAVFGVSMGGAIAQQLVLEHPDRVSALILGITWARPIEFMRRQHAVARTIIETLGPDALVETSLIRMFTPQFFEVGREAIDRMLEVLAVDDAGELAAPQVLLAQLDAIDKHDVLADLQQVSCPALVFGGRLDMMVPFFASEEIAAAIPGSELTAFETGHGCMVEEMEAVNRAVARFLSGL